MRVSSAGVLTAAADSGMLVFGIVMALLGAVLPAVSAQLHLTLPQAGNLFAVMNAAMLICQVLIGPALDRFGQKPALVAGPAMVGAALVLIAGADSYRALWPALALLGFGGGMLNGATNTLVADLWDEPRRKNAALNRLGVYYGIGAVLLPFSIAFLLEQLGLARILYVAAGLAVLPSAAAIVLRFPPPHLAESPAPADIARLAMNPLVVAFAALLFAFSGCEFIIAGFSATFLTTEVRLSMRQASFLLALYWCALIGARMFLGRLLISVRGGAVIRFSALCAFLGVGLLAAAQSDIAAIPAMVLTGAGMASIFPTTLGLAGARFAERSGTVFGILLAVGLAGGMALPWALARLGAAYGLREAWMLPAFGLLVIFFLQTFLDRVTRMPRAVGD